MYRFVLRYFKSRIELIFVFLWRKKRANHLSGIISYSRLALAYFPLFSSPKVSRLTFQLFNVSSLNLENVD